MSTGRTRIPRTPPKKVAHPRPKVIVISLLTAAAIFMFCCGLGWLALGIGGFTAVYWLGKKAGRRYRCPSLLRGLAWLLYLFAGTLLFRLFIAEIYAVPSESMEDTLYDGDNILMSKLNYGPRSPTCLEDIPWSGLLYLFGRSIPAGDTTAWQYHRLGGFTHIHHGDILVFRIPEQGTERLIKRCVGLPGERISVKGDSLLIDGRLAPTIATTKQPYSIRFTDVDAFGGLMDDKAIVYSLPHGDSTHLSYAYSELTPLQKMALKASPLVTSIRSDIIPPGGWPPIYPTDSNNRWSIDHYGPVLVPGRGMHITLTPTSYHLYQKVFELYENVSITDSAGGFYIDGRPASTYTFKKDYFFVLGDNRHDSNDSRYWGFLPMQRVEGKAVCILFSFAGGSFQWRRLLKWL